MKATEVVGNWFTARSIGNKPVKVTEVYKSTDYPFVWLVRVRCEGLMYSIRLDELEPIPLTEKIFTLSGFEYDEQMNAMIFRFDREETYIHIEYVFGINRIRISIDPYRCGYAIDTEIRYVHQLQHALRLCGLNALADNFKLTADGVPMTHRQTTND